MANYDVEFRSPEELAELLEVIGLKLHALNRIAAGESGYVWYLAESIRIAGQLATRIANKPELDALYGDGYQAGRLKEEAKRDHFLGLLREAFSRDDIGDDGHAG